MSEQPPFWNRVFGGPIEPETDHVAELQDKVGELQDGLGELKDEFGELKDGLGAIRQEVRKLGKAQYKANTLVEGQSTRWQATADALNVTQAENTALVQQIAEQAAGAGRHDLLQALLPAIDSVEQAMLSGVGYLHQRDLLGGEQMFFSADHQPLASDRDREALAGWLSGLRLVRERLLGVLAQDGVTRIATVGDAFNPYLHVAVGTVSAETPTEHNQIAREQQAGYQSKQGVLRYAQVIVKKVNE